MRSVEGVTRFQLEHQTRTLEPWVYADRVRELSAWRELLNRLGLLGRDPSRYGGLGFGNMSARVGPNGAVARGKRRFLVTGTQTGHRTRVDLSDFCVVESYDLAANRVCSFGPVAPSSESLSHGAVYDVAPDAQVVFHVHAPEIWEQARSLHLPTTSPEVANGTPEMAREVQRLCRESAAREMGVIVMSGHEDGVIAFGSNPEFACGALVRCLARALASRR